MHLYLMTRGIKHDVDRFITELQGKYLPMKYPDKEGKLQNVMIQTSVRPIQLYEIVFPEEHKDVVLNTLLSGGQGKTQHKKHNKFIFAIRKALGVEKIPEYDKTNIMPLYVANVEKIGIGIKKDYYQNVKGERWNNPTKEEIEKNNLFEGI